ncbi:MAG: hypothetical protein JWO33_1007 [Caulobacteraceae bacterium]|nr:hypothetical protein [Caulobacteraceae bacterium]
MINVQHGLREPAPGMRELQAATAHAARKVREPWRGVIRSVIGSALFGSFLAFVGVHAAAPGGRLFQAGYMTALVLVALVTAAGLRRALTRMRWGAVRSLPGAFLVGLLQTPTMGLLVWTTDNLLTGRGWPLHRLPTYLGVSLFNCLLLNLVAQLLLRRTPAPTEAIPATAPTRFLARLAPKLRGADIWAVEAQDHYLRLHTSKGEDLILLRMADAVADLAGLEGAQVHRSWWVSRDAIADIRHRAGRVTLTLKGGGEVPVSRAFARILRQRGWLRSRSREP